MSHNRQAINEPGLMLGVSAVAEATNSTTITLEVSASVETTKSAAKRPHRDISGQPYAGELSGMSDTRKHKAVKKSHSTTAALPNDSSGHITSTSIPGKSARYNADGHTPRAALPITRPDDGNATWGEHSYVGAESERAAQALAESRTQDHSALSARVALLERLLIESDRSRKEAVTKAHMDSVLELTIRNNDIKNMKEHAKRLENSLANSRIRNQKLADQIADVKSEEQKRIERLIQAHKQEVEAYKQDIEHLQVKCSTLDEDLDELKLIANEEARARVEGKSREGLSGLPPAYGSLEDEHDQRIDLNASTHKDGGAFTVATIKSQMRAILRAALSKAHEQAASIRASQVNFGTHSADSLVFLAGMSALDLCCGRLGAALNCAGEMMTEKLESHPTGLRIIKEKSRMSFTADRITKLIFDLCWRVISAHDQRPVQIFLTTRQRLEVAGHLQHVDLVMERAIRLSFICRHTADAAELLSELQLLLTQLSVLQDSFTAMRLAMNKNMYFEKAWRWLSEQVETQRQLVASERLRQDPFGGDRCAREGSEASSVPMGSDSSSEPGEHLAPERAIPSTFPSVQAAGRALLVDNERRQHVSSPVGDVSQRPGNGQTDELASDGSGARANIEEMVRQWLSPGIEFSAQPGRSPTPPRQARPAGSRLSIRQTDTTAPDPGAPSSSRQSTALRRSARNRARP